MSEDIPLASTMADSLPSLEESIAYLEAREDYQQAKAEYKVYLEERKPRTAAQRTEELDALPLNELVKILDEQLPFDLVVGIIDFLQELGAFNEPLHAELQSDRQEDKHTGYSEEVLIDETDLNLLASVLPPTLASKLARSPFAKVHEDPSILKSSLLNTLARLALSPPLTVPIARSFRPVFVDLASRWLLILGFNGTGYHSTQASTNTLVRVLTALARTLPEFPQLYPILILALNHPHLQAESLDQLLSSTATPFVPEGPSSAINASAPISDTIYHPEVPQLLLTLYSLLVAVPQLPLIQTIRRNFGGPAPPRPVGDVLSSHPHLSMRTLAWEVATLWFGWKGPKKEELRRRYVYDPVLDEENGRDGHLKTDIPLRNPAQPPRHAEWLSFWPRVPRQSSAQRVTSNGLRVRVELPQIDAWAFAEFESALSTHEWTVQRSNTPEQLVMSSEDGAMDVDVMSAGPTLPINDTDRSPLLAYIAGIPLLKEAYIASTIATDSVGGRELEHAQTAGTLPVPEVFVQTATSIAALRQLALHVSARTPVLLSSPPSAGKATTLQELHRVLYQVSSLNVKRSQDIVSINLADKSLDAKNLLGTLTSSPTEPGAFVFAEGSLTRAIRHGRWVVLEDIDKASDEVLSTISELVERISRRAQKAIGGGWGGVALNGVGVHAGGQWVEASENFMLFATRSVPTSAVQAQASSNDGSTPVATFFGSQYWSQVWMDVPNNDEIQDVIEGRFPRLAKQIVVDLVQTWSRIVESTNSIYSTSTTGLTRTIGIRDLVKWCRRVEASLPHDINITTFSQNPRFQDEVFLDARDIFLSSFPTRNAVYEGVLEALQTGLDLSQERVDWALQSRVPEILSTGDKPGSLLHYGRISLVKGKTRQRSATKRPYALTKPFLLLLEELAAAVKSQEPMLLVGETGTGKTTAVAQLAEMLGHNLTALNLSNQTEASDLLGGFRPINEAEEVARKALELVNGFTDLFAASFEASRNLDFGVAVQKAFKKKRWSRLAGLFSEAARLAEDKLARTPSAIASENDGPRKKRKTHHQAMLASWLAFRKRVAAFEEMANEAASKSSKFKFSFVEGPLIRALRNGDWVLLDEVNLATSETLESLSSLLQSASSSLVLTERGDLEPVQRHPDFRVFACMNPANDVGKRDLPPSLRVKFTEVFVAAPDSDKEVLLSVIHGYIGHVAVGDRGVVQDIAELYLSLKGLSQAGRIADGSGHPPHFSMRTLARSLVFTADFAREFGIRRSAYEGIAMCFTTSLEASSKDLVHSVMHEYLVDRSKSPRSFFKSAVQPPSNAKDFVSVGNFWLAKGNDPLQAVDDYVLTASVEDKLVSLARAIAAARFPILLQGPTSSGKTSIIEYLAKRSGHSFVRINNHEHTDIQEYLGTYMSDPESGKLVFQEGLLVTAVREGYWIVLDELNLAPTDVLEALNRLLDDNRELVIPETQEVVKPHPHFMLFATQNPPGLYGGRKVLSRAFRNRFLEMQFSDVPQDELETILCQRCQIAPSYAKKIVAVFLELQRRRQNTRLFEEKQAFVTLRDLFRWGNRAAVGYEQLALDGYMLLAERTRKDEDKETVKEVIEQIMKVSLNPRQEYEDLFHRFNASARDQKQSLVWTTAMKRLYVLIRTALSFNEPVLLVGETGSGKTSVCQAIAHGLGQKLHIVNCHLNTETSDLIGSQRPVRNKKAVQELLRLEALDQLEQLGFVSPMDASFETAQASIQAVGSKTPETDSIIQRMIESQALFMWHDGPLVEAMRQGDMLLLDEISLADDSVLERLNSVLEPARILTVAEKGSKQTEDARVRAHVKFQIIGTMNPGGDFGKKELSPALRNRFTEIWVPWLSDEDDILGILHSRLAGRYQNAVASAMLTFAQWFTEQVIPREPYSFGSVVTLRDLLAWTDFLISYDGEEKEAFIHGAMMTLVDSLGSTSHTSGFNRLTITTLRDRSMAYLESLVSGEESNKKMGSASLLFSGDDVFQHFLSRLSISDGTRNVDWHFSFSAPTVRLNALRVMRALQVSKPILLEGSPGVGKTSLALALARSTGHALCRINLSDQTDLVDLFGSDSPVEGGKPGEFAWVNAPFLAAMQEGHWVLLDEMNLASQSVLEGLNSCLDHRGTVYIPELDKVFSKHPDFRIFAAQNPTNQGGSRKGLPRSFVDRFTQVYMDDLDELDYFDICQQLYPSIESSTIRNMVTFVVRLGTEIAQTAGIFSHGAPWELNLRDLLRWLSMMSAPTGYERYPGQPEEHLDPLFVQRFRTIADRDYVLRLFEDVFGKFKAFGRTGRPAITSTNLRIGANIFMRLDPLLAHSDNNYRSRTSRHLRAMEALGNAIASNQLLILTGCSGSGKTALIEDFANCTGRSIVTFNVNAQTDTLEMLGSFEQCSRARHLSALLNRLQSAIDSATADSRSESLWPSMNRMSRILAELRSQPLLPLLSRQALLDQLKTCARGTSLEGVVEQCTSALEDSGLNTKEAGRFEFVDGILVQAMLNGNILVVENANRCNPAVLDRLNGLFEPGGILSLSERGLGSDGKVLEVKPHPNFRVIMTLDPRAGELSRAMRNRGIEVALLEESAVQTESRQLSQQLTGLVPTQTDLPPIQVQAGEIVKATLPLHDFNKTLLVHSVGSQVLTALPCLQHKQAEAQGLREVLHAMLQHDIWTVLQQHRPGQVVSDLPAQSHSVAFFSLDTNEALKARPDLAFKYQTALDELLSGLFDVCVSHFEGILHTTAALSKPTNGLTILEQSYLHAEYPARLPIVAKGIESIRQLQFALVETAQKAIAPAAFEDLDATVALLKDVSTCLAELLVLAGSFGLNYTVYQALLSEIKRRLNSALIPEFLVSQCRELNLAITFAEDSVKRSTGHAMEAIWKYTREAVAPLPVALTGVEKCDTAHLPIDLNELYMDVVKSTYREDGVSDPSLLDAVREVRDAYYPMPEFTDEMLQKIMAFETIPCNRSTPTNGSIMVSLSELATAAQLIAQPLERLSFVQVASRAGQRDLSSLTAILRQMVDPTCSPIQMLREWLDQLVRQSRADVNPTIVQDLLTDSELRSSLDIALFSRLGPLSNVSTMAEGIAVAGQSQFALATIPKSSRKHNLTVLAMALIVETLRASTILPSVEGLDYKDLPSLIKKITTVLNESETKPGISPLYDALQRLNQARNKDDYDLHDLSRLYLCLAACFWRLYVPDIPLDPLLASHAINALYKRETQKLLAEASVEGLAVGEPGGTGARRLECIVSRLADLASRLQDTDSLDREDGSAQELLTALFAELRACSNVLLQSEILEAIVTQDGLATRPQLENLQGSLVSIHARLGAFYGSYSDLVQPVTLALGSAILGLGIRIHHSQIAEQGRLPTIVSDVVRRLVSRPSSTASQALVDLELPTSANTDVLPSVPPATTPLLTLQAIAAMKEDGRCQLQESEMRRIYLAYDQIYALWTIDHKRAEQARIQSESIYRSRREDVQVASDAAQEEEELLSLFPTFDDPDDSSAPTSSLPEGSDNSNGKTLLRYADIRSVYSVHKQLFTHNEVSDLKTTTARQALAGAKMALLEQLHTSSSNLISESVDISSSPAALHILAETARDFSKDEALESADFYQDTNIQEAMKLRDLLKSALKRITELMTAWPEQMVLVELANRCNALLAVASTAPIARMLTFVESLLFKITDWEAYASRETSLSSVSDRLTALVVDWRRLELKSWAGLLEAQERAFREPVAEWWFRMFDLCIHGPNALRANDSDPAGQSEYIETLVRLVRAFVEESPAGQFKDKLCLVQSFADLSASLQGDFPLFASIATALRNLSSFYDMQLLRIDVFLRDEKKKIAKDVNEVIRLASWKDVNVYALKASAQKSHRQLYKRVRALRKVLEAPALRFGEDSKPLDIEQTRETPVAVINSSEMQTLRAAFVPISEIASSSLPKPLVNIERTLSRLEGIVETECLTTKSTPADSHLEVLSESIIIRSRELRAEAPTGTTKEERQKQGNALMDRKRKAWSSLLAETKRIGLSARPSTTLVQALSRMSILFDAGPFCECPSKAVEQCPTVLKSLDSYFYRFCAIMPQVRLAAAQHHPDVLPSQLQGAAGFLDSALKLIHTSRRDLCKEITAVAIISEARRKLEMLEEEGIASSQIESVNKTVNAVHLSFSLLQCALEEIIQSGQQHLRFMGATDKTAFARLQLDISECVREAHATRQQLDTVLQSSGAIAPITCAHMKVLESARATWKEIAARLSLYTSVAPQLHYILNPTLAWIEQNEHCLAWSLSGPDSAQMDVSKSALKTYTDTMSAILVTIQNLGDGPNVIIEEDDDYVNGGLIVQYRQLREKMQLLHTGSIGKRTQTLMAALAEMTMHNNGILLASQLVTRSIPFLTSYLRLVNDHINQYIGWHRALLKFMYIFAQTTLTLAKEGFCRPTESDEGASEASNFEGTGMGSGEGTKNVSDQIENQEQVEGLEDEQDQDAPADQDDSTGKDDMLDMDDDFGGKTQDVNEEESDKESDDGEDRDEEDLDEELGKVDPLDPTAVDDKFWDDKEEQQDDAKSPPPEEQSGQNAGVNDASEVGERREPDKAENRDDPAPDEGEEAKGEEKGTEPELEKDNPDSAPDETEDDAAEAEEGPRQELPDVNMDEQTLDLPDDLELDGHRSGEEDDEIDDELNEDQADPDHQDTNDGDETIDIDENVGEHQDDAVNEEAPLEENEASNQDDGFMTHESAGPDQGSGENVNSAGESGRTDSNDVPTPADKSEEQQASAEVGAEQMGDEEQTREQTEPQANAAESSAAATAGDGKGAEDGMQSTQDQPGNGSDAQAAKQEDKQLGDATQTFMRRLEAISQPGDAPRQDNDAMMSDTNDMNASTEVEYIREGEEDAGLQATGAADEDEATKHGAEMIEPDMLDEFQALDLEQSQPAEDQTLLHHIPQAIPNHDKSIDGQELAEMPEEPGNGPTDDHPRIDDNDGHARDMESLPEETEDLNQTEVQLQHWLANGRESLPSEEVWRLYTNLTRDLSFSLTESLRLVLEPTLATRLKGDYRTGKRLNMRKIIPYIASDYTKDKIWLRRTRPSQREYQVLLALDDSRSMADSRAVHLAYQTLALVCQSLTKLEVGEVSVCKFGEHTKFIHNFEDGPVSESVGARIVDSFQFAQKSTDVRRLLENSLERFQSARDRRGGSAADLWQLEIIVSDGMCQDLEDIRALLRKARQQKVMVMFVVLDSLHGNNQDAKDSRQDSILSMKSVSYQKSKSGALELKMERYMDTFPFEYYVVLRDVEALPEILGETLRQFFETVRGDNA